jgi:polynucleotide 5'-kinase involved in rRNA processing
MLDPRSAIHAPHPDTREWFLGLEQYTEWKDRDQGLLRIKGNLGAGKSTLMAFLHKRLKKQLDPNAILLEFFNRTTN